MIFCCRSSQRGDNFLQILLSFFEEYNFLNYVYFLDSLGGFRIETFSPICEDHWGIWKQAKIEQEGLLNTAEAL